MCDLPTTVYLTLIAPALILLCAEYAACRLPLDMPQAWEIGACIGMLVSTIFTFFILPNLVAAGFICSEAWFTLIPSMSFNPSFF